MFFMPKMNNMSTLYSNRCYLLLILLFSVLISVNAANISVMIIETGLDAEKEKMQYSGLWESGVLDVFFESGHIVSNAPIMRLDYIPDEIFPAEAEKDLNEAKEGSMEYLLVVQINYKNLLNGRPKQVVMRLFKILPFKLLHEENLSDAKSRNTKEEFEFIKQAARIFISKVK